MKLTLFAFFVAFGLPESIYSDSYPDDLITFPGVGESSDPILGFGYRLDSGSNDALKKEEGYGKPFLHGGEDRHTPDANSNSINIEVEGPLKYSSLRVAPEFPHPIPQFVLDQIARTSGQGQSRRYQANSGAARVVPIPVPNYRNQIPWNDNRGYGIKTSVSGYGSDPDGTVESQGSFAFTFPDSQDVQRSYVADTAGYGQESAWLPVAPDFPHPIPKFVLDQIARTSGRDLSRRNQADPDVNREFPNPNPQFRLDLIDRTTRPDLYRRFQTKPGVAQEFLHRQSQ